MGQKLHRVVRACAEMGAANPILAIHDQGAGGNGMQRVCCGDAFVDKGTCRKCPEGAGGRRRGRHQCF